MAGRTPGSTVGNILRQSFPCQSTHRSRHPLTAWSSNPSSWYSFYKSFNVIAESPQTSRARVLVVDDEPANLAVVRQLLSDRHDIRVANQGQRALELAAASPPDLLLLDVDMPGLDGYATCLRFKALPGCSDVPVIFLTSRSDVQDEERGFEVGAVDYIHKPISPPVLRARVRTQLELRRALETARAQRRKADEMLNVVLPPVAADEIRLNGTVIPKRVERAVVMFADVAGFTAWCGARPPEEVVATLHRLFIELEAVARDHGIEKLKTIGDGFMAAAGLLTPVGDPLLATVRCGLEMSRVVPRHVPSWRLRVGVHVGPVVAGIVGGERYQFDIWGDTVNMAARLTSVGNPGSVCMAADVHRTIADQLESVDGGLKHLKGKGEVHVFEVTAVR